MIQAQSHVSSEQPATPRLRLDVLDGIRGLAALYVALFHAVGYAGHTTTSLEQYSAPLRLVAWALSFGSYAVPIFIVLSGFCLMLPLAQRGTDQVQGGVTAYLRRRAWRILPPYYVALLLSLLMILFIPLLQTPQQTDWDTKIPLSAGAIFAHLLLVHNLHPDWLFKINGPMWSVAIEWQIYFLFPTLILPLLRRTNMVVTVAVAMAVGLLPHFALPHTANFDHSHPWFLGLFSLGMAGASIAFSRDPRVSAYRRRMPWGRLNGALTLVLIGGLALNQDWMNWHDYISEPLVGLIVMSWLIQYASATSDGRPRRWSQRLLESRAAIGLGIFSYSIYLVHNPIQALINLATLKLDLSADARLALMLGVATPAALICAFVFYLLVERHCIRAKDRAAPATTIAAPAPQQSPSAS